jgi:hypothetical protein
MTEPDELEIDLGVEKFEAELEAAATPDEKLAVLKKYMADEYAECWLERILNPSPHIGCVRLHDAPVDDAAVR